ncbi:MAG: hypothetical protein ACRDWT_19390 [Jatrophihabitantaceae bacterium]
MSEPFAPPPSWAPPPAAEHRPAHGRIDYRDLVAVVILMSAGGALLGLVWQWWSPAGPAGYVIGPGRIQPDETEAFVAGDGRYAMIVVASGIVAALLVWFGRIARGIPAVLALALGGLAGAGLTALVGHLTGGGKGTGRTNTVIDALPLSVHTSGLVLAEAAAAVLVYALCVSFAHDDDLGEADPARDLARASVRPDVELQYAGGDGDGPGGLQQGNLPPQ